MRIGIDISQTAYEGTGVGRIVENLVENLIQVDNDNEYVLFFSSLRRTFQNSIHSARFAKAIARRAGSGQGFKIQNHSSKLKIKTFRLPPRILDFIWNRLHIFPIEWFIGNVDVFISSDWTEPPTVKAKKVTILYDFVVYKYPEETAKKIVAVQKRKLKWTKKECQKIVCISKSTKKDAMEILGIEEKRLAVVYPGVQV